MMLRRLNCPGGAWSFRAVRPATPLEVPRGSCLRPDTKQTTDLNCNKLHLEFMSAAGCAAAGSHSKAISVSRKTGIAHAALPHAALRSCSRQPSKHQTGEPLNHCNQASSFAVFLAEHQQVPPGGLGFRDRRPTGRANARRHSPGSALLRVGEMGCRDIGSL